jgi:hypothetical protein
MENDIKKPRKKYFLITDSITSNERQMRIGFKEKYNEKGYTVKKLFKNIAKNIKKQEGDIARSESFLSTVESRLINKNKNGGEQLVPLDMELRELPFEIITSKDDVNGEEVEICHLHLTPNFGGGN